jgi:hypothetical protein
MRSAYKILIGKPEGKRLFGRTRHRSEDSIRRNLKKGRMWTGCIWLRIGTTGGLF